MSDAGRKKTYTPKQLLEAVERYFDSISRVVTAKEKVPTKKKDEYGHPIMRERVIKNQLGQPITYVEYVVPPTIGGLILYLDISNQTWCNYQKDERYLEATTCAQGRRRAYLEKENLVRSGGGLRGVQFDLQNNFSASERVTVEVHDRGGGSAGKMSLEEKEALLRELAMEFGSAEEGGGGGQE